MTVFVFLYTGECTVDLYIHEPLILYSEGWLTCNTSNGPGAPDTIIRRGVTTISTECQIREPGYAFSYCDTDSQTFNLSINNVSCSDRDTWSCQYLNDDSARDRIIVDEIYGKSNF